MRRQSFDVLVVGPTERDLLFVTKTDAPAYGSTIDVKEVPVTLTGSGSNVAVALARLGLKVGLVTAVGRDPRGDEVLRELANEGVDTSLTARTALAGTGLAVTVLREGGTDSPLVLRSRGSNDLVEVTEDVQKMLHTSRWLFLGQLSGAWEQQETLLLEGLRKEETRLAWHPGPVQVVGARELGKPLLLERTDLLFVDEPGLTALSGQEGPRETAERILLSRGVKTIVSFSNVSRAHVVTPEVEITATADPPAVTDPRGSRDAFCAAFLAGYMQSTGDLSVALRWALTNSRSVVGTLTTQRGLLGRAVLEERVRKTNVAIEQRRVTRA